MFSVALHTLSKYTKLLLRQHYHKHYTHFDNIKYIPLGYMNKMLENNSMDNNIYLSDINLLGILDEQQKIKIILIDSLELQEDEEGQLISPLVIIKCNYRDFNTEKKGKFINTDESEEQKISILTTENIQSLENYLEKDLIDSLNKFDLTSQSSAGRKKTQKYKKKKINTRKNKQPKRNK